MRKILLGAAAAALLATTAFTSAAEAETLRLSHQWSTSDVRHKVAEIIKEHVENADVDLEIQIFPTQSLFKAREQWQPTSRGQLDMTVFPLAYAGGVHPEFNLTLMPGLVKSHDHAARLNESEFMDEIKKIAEDDGVKILVDGYLAGGFAGKEVCITAPEDVEGLQTRAAGKSFEQMLAAAGASIASMASSEIYNAMQTGVLDAANTSSSSFVSYRIYEQVACYTPVGDYALWFMYQPVLISMRTWEGLNDEQRVALEEGAAKAERYYLEEAKKQDENARRVFADAGVEIAEMTEEEFNAWREIAQQSSYQEFLKDVPDGQRLLDMALSVE
jgi:TRAP-type C4-dicarboxylate transport system substrate-binding protein